MTRKILLLAFLLVNPLQSSALDLGAVAFEGAISAVGQRVNAEGSSDGSAQTRLGYRGDLGATLPLGQMGGGEGSVVAQLRFGQGSGVSTVPTYTGAVNSLAFQAGEPGSNTVAILSQLYYQWRLDDKHRNRYSVTVGKLDPFGFFDQNAVADDESASFLNNVFVHNPLLDSGGDLGADEYGFTPGVVTSWERYDDEGSRFGMSFGVFGVDEGAGFDASPGPPFSIVQLSYSPRNARHESLGTWRIYGWHNPRAGDPAGNPQRHSGWGLSVDQQLGTWVTAFGRYGHGTQGTRVFDRALTLGVELNGARWSRPDDRIGLAVGRLSGGSTRSPTDSHETITELFYRAALTESISLTPHWQTIRHPAGELAANRVQVLGLRAGISF